MKTISRLFQTILSFSLTLHTSAGFAATEVQDLAELRKRLGVEKYEPTGYDLANVKIAILDVGFKGYREGKGMLPDTAVHVVDPKKKTFDDKDHGLRMAQIVWAVTGKTANGPKIYLLNASGLTNFKKAVDFVIENKVDIVLHSAIWQFGGNFDGGGPINAQVNRATERGVIWINAAGNDSKMVYNSLIDENIRRDRFLKLRDNKDYIRFENKIDDNKFSVILTWTDFKDDDKYAAVKDLDLFIYDDKGALVASGEKIQRGEAPPEDDLKSQLSIIARETVKFPKDEDVMEKGSQGLARGTYIIKVKAKTDNFFPKDSLRILISTDESQSADSINFIDRTAGMEIFPPADNPTVFTVGENSTKSAEGLTTDKRLKPDIILDNAVVKFTNGTTMAGSSNAAAIIAGEVVLLKALCKSLSYDNLSDYAAKLKKKIKEYEDIVYINPKDVPKRILDIVPTGGKIMSSLRNGHLVILTPVDPLTLPLFQGEKGRKAQRKEQSDIIAVNKDLTSWFRYPIEKADTIEQDHVEFRRLQSEVGTWQPPKASNACLNK